jgi:dihydroxyacetone kinase DhaKLM complex PTS-EIIA-like component DhaM
MRIATLYRAGAMNELVKEMDEYEVDICALQGIRWPGKGTATKRIM